MAKANETLSATSPALVPTALPWKACSEPFMFSGEPFIAAENGRGLILAHVSHKGKGNYEGQLGDPIADARIMAAAPELLDACYLALEEIQQWDEIMGGSEDPRTRSAIDALKYAIAKAYGKAA